jgi:thioesterase domain-containing protein
VIRSSNIEFHRPIHGTLRAICRAPDAGTLETFRLAFEKKARARIRLQITLEEEGQVCASFEGTFVVLR